MKTKLLTGAFLAALVFAVTPASGQNYLVNEDFEGTVFPPPGWQETFAEWTDTQSHSPTHSVLLNPSSTLVIPTLSGSRDLYFQYWVNQVAVNLDIYYSDDGSDWTFLQRSSTNPAAWFGAGPIDVSTLPIPLHLQFRLDPWSDPTDYVYIDDIQVTSSARANPSSNLVLQADDYTGDGRTDIAIFRPSTGLWGIRSATRIYFGQLGDIPVSGDYNGDGIADVSIFRPATGLWAVKGITRVYFGSLDDLPVPADYSGDGICEIAIFRPATGLWTIRGGNQSYFGRDGDIPVPGDYRGEEVDRMAVFRPANGLWAVRGVTRAYFGKADDWPLPGIYQWYGASGRAVPFKDQMAIFRPSTSLWAVRGGDRNYFGNSQDHPVVGGFTGSIIDEFGIFRPANGLWAIRDITRVYFGTSGDVPLAQ